MTKTARHPRGFSETTKFLVDIAHGGLVASRTMRCVGEVRWRWTLKVLKTAAWVDRNFWAEPGLALGAGVF